MLQERLLETEKRIRFQPFETGVLFAANGEKLWEKEGERTDINVEEPVRKKLMQGSVFTHNHPLNCSFSLNDLKVFLAHGLLEMRAVDAKYLYSMTLDPKHPLSVSQVFKEAKAADRDVEAECQARLREDIDAELFEDYWHEVFTRVVGRVPGFIYKRIAF